MSYVYISLVKHDINNFGEAYIVHGAREFQLASLALGSEACNVTGKVGDRTLSSEQWRGEGSRASHVKLATAATSCQTSQSDELVSSRCGHVGGSREM
jgi:hypothetical protein